MTKTINNNKNNSLYFWLGADAEEFEMVSETEFNKRQENWNGARPTDFEDNERDA